MRFKKWIWIFMFLLALVQRTGKIQVFLIEVFIYLIISWYFKKVSGSEKKQSEKKLYKYENLDNQETSDRKLIEQIDWETVDSDVQEAKDKLAERKQRVESYDYREFIGRKDVDWEEVYDYLWKQCRYKGILMWNEYMNYLISKGIINEVDKKLVFKKAGNYIPFKPRLDLEAIQKIERDDVRSKDKEESKFIESINAYNQKLYVQGVVNEKQLEKMMIKDEKSDNYLKTFDYEKYLKRKGYV